MPSREVGEDRECSNCRRRDVGRFSGLIANLPSRKEVEWVSVLDRRSAVLRGMVIGVDIICREDMSGSRDFDAGCRRVEIFVLGSFSLR